ncbi:MAG: hypothetical protein IPN96_20130 [Anaerolineales bacterium]|jgi:hypothetical protein|uniref:hypothetical protein n=1 Tax=Candidatus Villigracilis proximus TaxID=3140683 RepID=UPI003136A3BF|nr:hypothetical protein [Anaerolineales bacterium]MBK8821596.1 hypothetical protein [Anaerolineales bacterium]MBK9211032.1 hypothetical protein [Anaerolineales bacterium]
MTTPKAPLPKIPPFFEKKNEPPHNRVDTRGMLSIATMFVSLAALTVSMLGATRLIIDVFNDGLAAGMDGILVKIVVLGFAFLFGWGIGLVSIRGFGNLVYHIIIKIYAWACIVAVGLLYIKVIQKLYMQIYDGMHFWAYLIILLGGLIVLFFLHLLIEGHDLRPFAIPLLIISVVHLFVIVYRYVFAAGTDGQRVLGDLTIFIVMISISALMLMHIGIFSPIRDQIDDMFSKNGNSDHKNNGDE